MSTNATSQSTPLPLYDERALPAGWLKRIDERVRESRFSQSTVTFSDLHHINDVISCLLQTNHPFYVDTLGRPPHSIWVHPLDDLEYLRKTGQIYPDEEDAPPDYPADEKICPSNEDDPQADSSESAIPAETASALPAAAAAGPSESTSAPGPSKTKATIFSKLKGKSKAAPANLTPAKREAKRESEAKAYFAQREVMLAKRKEESSDTEFARLLTRPYTAPLPSDYGGPRYMPPVHKSFGQKMNGFADGAFNLLFGL
jgi:hypothetical protein